MGRKPPNRTKTTELMSEALRVSHIKSAFKRLLKQDLVGRLELDAAQNLSQNGESVYEFVSESAGVDDTYRVRREIMLYRQIKYLLERRIVAASHYSKKYQTAYPFQIHHCHCYFGDREKSEMLDIDSTVLEVDRDGVIYRIVERGGELFRIRGNELIDGEVDCYPVPRFFMGSVIWEIWDTHVAPLERSDAWGGEDERIIGLFP